ncbi:anti-sigma factor family protein [Streptomyces sp. NPDC049879]|uniref:anti-sigma factor family protein n=1 Tax=Streptomyces sp. NPDC049879 TaxID=3365598 RepID=UPI00378CDCE6
MSETQHPDPAEIAALDEDLLPPEETAVLRAHIAECPACADVAADFALLRQELHALPLPPMPDDVAARIDAALGELDVSRETKTPAAGTPDHDTAPKRQSMTAVGTPGRSRRRWPRLALAAAGAVVAVALGSIALDSLGTGLSDEDNSASSLADASDDGGRSADPVLEDQVRDLLAESEAGGALSTPESLQEPSRPPGASEWSTEQGQPGQDDEGEEQGEGMESGAQEADPDALLSDVPTCVEDAIGRSEAPLAAEEEDYAGTEAYLVVFPHAVDPEQVDAYVVDADCVSATPPVSGEVLVRASYPRD